ncbi:MAG: hypothetical protein PGN23_03595 [Sphingomonas adhaesiva]|uniref:hypothetical protein n=1 Tax=Sphingomonas adhaesiva TaxID=28212 RepID=UPI002FF97CD2
MNKPFLLAAVLLASPAAAQDVTPRANEPVAAVLAKPQPVTAGDILDRPYRVLGPVRATVRKTTIFDKPVSEVKVYRELWERARRMGADAVILADYAAPETELGKVGAREASGKAIKFVP